MTDRFSVQMRIIRITSADAPRIRAGFAPIGILRAVVVFTLKRRGEAVSKGIANDDSDRGTPAADTGSQSCVSALRVADRLIACWRYEPDVAASACLCSDIRATRMDTACRRRHGRRL